MTARRELDRFQVSEVAQFAFHKACKLEQKSKRSVNGKNFEKLGQAAAWQKAGEWIVETIGDCSGLKTPAVAYIDEVGDYLVSIAPKENDEYLDGFEEATADVIDYIAFVCRNMGEKVYD